MNGQFKVKHPKNERYRKILSILSPLVKTGNLTDKEIDIIIELNSLGGTLTTQVRKTICDKLIISSDHLNNYVKKLRAKSAITKDDLNAALRVDVVPDDQPQVIAFILEAV